MTIQIARCLVWSLPRRVAASTFVVLILTAFSSQPFAVADQAARPEGSATPSNSARAAALPTTDGGTIRLIAEDSPWTVVCVLGTECPLARIYGPRLSEMAERFGSRGVRFVGVDSNLQDSMAELRRYGEEHRISFPLAKDHDQQVARALGATRTPEVFLLDANGAVVYQGRIDDQYRPGITRPEATVFDLRRAIEQVLAGQPITEPKTVAVGCLISFRNRGPAKTHAEVTFCDQISRLLNRHCVECHRPGEIGPFSLTDYDEVVGWADMMVEVVDQGRMPPWHAAPGDVALKNSRGMTETEKELLRTWADSGMPYGDASRLPERPEFVSNWSLPEPPDRVFPMSREPFPVPADGIVEYQYYVIDPGFEKDRWVRGAQVRPGNRRVVHHCIAFVRPPDGSDFTDFGLLAAYVPGQRNSTLPAGFAKRIPAGSKIVIQMHYTPTGRPEKDLTELGLLYADPDRVTHEVVAHGGIEHEFEIPPHDGDYEVSGQIGRYPRDGQLISIMPHMHLRGKSFQLTGRRGGNSQRLLDVPRYDFNWQHNYQLAEPLPLDDVDRMDFRAVFDNSADNPFNPDPTQRVTWGDQTWQEMAVVFIEVAVPRDPVASADSESATGPPVSESAGMSSRKRASKAFAERYLRKFDADGDGWLVKSEVPDSVRLFAFRRFDHNNDGRLDLDELAAEAMARHLDR